MPPPEWVVEHWPGSATVIAVRSHGIREGKPTDETRYYVTSLRTSARSLPQHVRNRWSIENSWHWVRDVPLREDAHRSPQFRRKGEGKADVSAVKPLSLASKG
jgi:predicted transposase YbfD/YdcC